MQLTQSQKTTLKSHMQANTNTTPTPGADGQTFVINTRLGNRNPTDQQAIADWYNGPALAGDSQPFATLFLWNNRVTEQMLATAVDWTTQPPHGLGGVPTVDQQQLAIGNKWWLWDQLIGRKGFIDFTDPQSRNGVLQVWGNVGPVNTNSTTSSAIGSETINPLVAKLKGRRVELALNSTAVGSKTAWNAAVVCPAGLGGVQLLGVPLTQPDVDDLLTNG